MMTSLIKLRSFSATCVAMLTWAVCLNGISVGIGHAQTKVPELRYKLKKGVAFEYSFSGSAAIDSTQEEFRGQVKLSVSDSNVKKNLSGAPLEPLREGTATSTAFGVTSDGYLLTCAHCVVGAEKLMVTTAAGELPARIIDVNKDLDLAIIKVNAKDLPTVSLARNADVELAQNVRAIGFPLSSVLGSSVKISQGAISGFLNNRLGRAYQIDVAVNPGNSGGPLVDDYGNVIGVVNAKLDGVAISKIGFSVPISFACGMLEKNGVKYDPQRKNKILAGPELAKLVTPAVCFVSAELGPNGYQSHSNFRMSVTGFIERENRKEHFFGQAIVGKNGDLLDTDGDEFIPFVFSSVCELPFELLPPLPANDWSTTQLITFQLPSRTRNRKDDLFRGLDMERFHSPDLDRFPDLHRFDDGFPFNSPFFNRRRSSTPGSRQVSYVVKGQNKDEVRIQRIEELKSLKSDATAPDVKFVNTRQLEFNTKKGMFTKCDMTGKLNYSIDGDTSEIPVSFSFKLIDETKPKIEIAKNERNEAKSKRSAKSRQPKEPDRLLIDFIAQKPMENNDRLRVLNRLASSRFKIDDSQKGKLVHSISSIAKSGTADVRRTAIEALLTLDKVAAIPLLADELNSANRFSKRGWVYKLAQTEHVDAAEKLCIALQEDYGDASLKQGLENMGAVAEGPVLKLLGENLDNDAATESLLEILAAIGTSTSGDTIRGWTKDGWKPGGGKKYLDRILER